MRGKCITGEFRNNSKMTHIPNVNMLQLSKYKNIRRSSRHLRSVLQSHFTVTSFLSVIVGVSRCLAHTPIGSSSTTHLLYNASPMSSTVSSFLSKLCSDHFIGRGCWQHENPHYFCFCIEGLIQTVNSRFRKPSLVYLYFSKPRGYREIYSFKCLEICLTIETFRVLIKESPLPTLCIATWCLNIAALWPHDSSMMVNLEGSVRAYHLDWL